MSRFKRTTNDRWIGGVLGGLSNQIGVDSTLLRVLFLLVYLGCAMYSQVLLLIYFAVWYFADEK